MNDRRYDGYEDNPEVEEGGGRLGEEVLHGVRDDRHGMLLEEK